MKRVFPGIDRKGKRVSNDKASSWIVGNPPNHAEEWQRPKPEPETTPETVSGVNGTGGHGE